MRSPTYGTCECCGEYGPLAPSLYDGMPLCGPCRAVEFEDGPEWWLAPVAVDVALLALS